MAIRSPTLCEKPNMNRHLILGLALTLLASSAFALPSRAPFPLVGEAFDTQTTPDLHAPR